MEPWHGEYLGLMFGKNHSIKSMNEAAEIKFQHMPDALYKFRSFTENHLAALQHDCLYSSGIDFLNDVREAPITLLAEKLKRRALQNAYDEARKNNPYLPRATIRDEYELAALLHGLHLQQHGEIGLPYPRPGANAFIDGQDTILTSAPSWWAVCKEGHVDAAKAFLQWCSEDAGQKILVEQAGFASPFTDCKYVASDPFAPVISSYISAGKTSNWHWMSMPANLGQNGIAPAFQAYAAGELDLEGYVTEVQRIATEWYSKL